MNQRIKELAEQAEKYANERTNELDKNWHIFWGEIYDKKFAELLVKECTEQVWYTREDGINGNVSEVIKDRIKQHFGVEE